MSIAESKPFYPLVAAHFFTFLIVGLPLPVLPLYVHNTLGYGTAVVGFTIGLHFVTTVLFRGLAGRLADTWGAKHTTVTGILLAAVSGVPYIFAAAPFIADEFKLGYRGAGKMRKGTRPKTHRRITGGMPAHQWDGESQEAENRPKST